MTNLIRRIELGVVLLVVLSVSYLAIDFLDKKVFHWRRAMTFSNTVIVDLVDTIIKLLPGIILIVTVGMDVMRLY